MASRVRTEQSNINSISSKVADCNQIKAKPTVNIHAQIKKAVCNPYHDNEQEWTDIGNKLNSLPYKTQPKKVIEKLDENDYYAAIHHAVLSKNRYACEKLIEIHKCDVNLVGKNGQTPLHLAMYSLHPNKHDGKEVVNHENNQNNHLELLTYLLERKGIKINFQDDRKRTPLHYAIMKGCVTCTDKLLNETKIQLHVRDIQGALPLHYICRLSPPIEKMLELLKPKSNEWRKQLNKRTVDQKQPLDIAAEHGNLEIIQTFFEKNFKEPKLADLPLTLHYAAVRHKEKTNISFLKNKRGQVPPDILHAACRQLHGHNSIHYLADTDQAVEKLDSDGFNALMVAVKHRRFECVKALLDTEKYTENVFKTCSKNSNSTVLHICADIKHDKITDILLEKLKELNTTRYPFAVQDVMGNTPLHICAQKGNAHMCEKLLYLYKELPRSIPGNKPIWHLKNYNTRIALQEAVDNNQLKVTEKILELVRNWGSKSCKEMINTTDDQCRTSLHIAALKGNFKMVELLISYESNVNVHDIDDNTPLHSVVSWNDDEENNANDRIDCIKKIIDEEADINALNILLETPLHSASRYGSFKLVKALLEYNADLLAKNVYGLNCLEAAIDEGNEDVVAGFIEHNQIFELMRNAQCRPEKDWISKTSCRVNTPMRKLIVNMPDMALRMLSRSVIYIGTENNKKEVYNYEFLDDQYFITSWDTGNHIDENGNNVPHEKENDGKMDAYTDNYRILIKNHPLFLMAKDNQMKLMAHPLSQRLAKKKYHRFGCWIFYISFSFYLIFIALFTSIVVRSKHPKAYYDYWNFSFNATSCERVLQAIVRSPNHSDRKQLKDKILQCALYSFTVLLLFKNIWLIWGLIRINPKKILTFLPEVGAISLGIVFIYDNEYQKETLMRCPTQWQYGAFGLFIGYLGLLYYIQYMHFIGIYVIMLKIITIRFILCFPVIICLLIGFGMAFHMLLSYEEAFKFWLRSLSEMIMMAIGELNFSENMFDEDDLAKPYYNLSYMIYILFAIGITILANNLLTSLAVGEVLSLMKHAKAAQNDMKFELIFDYEAFRLQFYWCMCSCLRRLTARPALYGFYDLSKIPCLERLENNVIKFFTQTTYIQEDMFDSDIEDGSEKQMNILIEIHNEVMKTKGPCSNISRHESVQNKRKQIARIVDMKAKNGLHRN